MASTTRDFLDRIMGGKLDSTLLAWKAEGLTSQRMAARLRTEFDVDVSYRTVLRWFEDMDTESVA